MRNEGKEPTDEGPQPEDGSTYTSAAAHRPHRRKQQAIAGAVGVAAVLGVGGAIIVAQAMTDSGTETTEVGAPPPTAVPAPPPVTPLPNPAATSPGASSPAASGPAASAPATRSPGGTPGAARTPGAAGTPRTAGAPRPAQVNPNSPNNPNPPNTPNRPKSPTSAAKADDAGKVGPPKPDKTLRPLPKTGSSVKESDVEVAESRSDNGRKTLKVASARTDLTGYGELAWVADDIERTGAIDCTKKIRLSPDVPATERPTLLVCWRLSATRSVYTVAVDRDGRPAREASVAALEKRWNTLG